MEYAYLKLLKQHNLKETDLPEDAQIGIENIKAIERGIAMLQKSPKYRGSIPPKTIAKIKANDKWVVNEILEVLDGRERNDSDEVPNDVEDVLDDVKPDNVDDVSNMKVGDKIDAEITKALAGKDTMIVTLHGLKEVAPITYNEIFDSYDAEGENGVVTSKYSILETEKEQITISKK